MKGLCYSAMTYAPLMVGRDVAVVGEAMMALGLWRTQPDCNPCYAIAHVAGELDTAVGKRVLSAENVEVERHSRLVQIKGDSTTRAVVIEHNGKQKEIPTDAIFIEKTVDS